MFSIKTLSCHLFMRFAMVNHYYLKRLETIDRLIRIKGTGSATTLAQRLGISQRCVYKDIAQLKKMGAPIEFCKHRNSYCYTSPGRFNFSFQHTE